MATIRCYDSKRKRIKRASRAALKSVNGSAPPALSAFVSAPFVRSPLSEKSAAVVRDAHYKCCCNEMKPYDMCDVTTRLEADDVVYIPQWFL